MKYFLIVIFLIAILLPVHGQVVKFIFTSDLHYGFTRPHFRGADSVPAYVVNAAQVAAIKSVPGVAAVIITGDIANREEKGIQPASVSWKEFLHDYRDRLKLKLFVTPGNHDASNATAHPKILFRDAGSMTGMLELEEGKHIDTWVYDYHTQKVNYSRNLGGIHCMFVNIWPDSANRVWMERDLLSVSKNTSVIIFAHDPPEGDAKHFTNANSAVAENLLEESYKDADAGSTMAEQKGFIAFLKRHANIKAYFHGHENFCEMYHYHGMPVFRSDSPMKGKDSREDESKLSFQLVTLDMSHHKMTVTEYLWNTQARAGKIVPGKTSTVAL